MHGDFQTALDINRRLAPLRMIAAGLLAAPIIFAAIVGAMALGAAGQSGAPAPAWPGIGGGQIDLPTLLRLIWLALAVSELPALILVRQAMLKRAATVCRTAPQVGRAETLSASIFNIFGTWTIIALAIPESLALLGGVTLMLSGQPLDALLVALPVAVMLALFPTRGRWEAFERSAQARAAMAR
jgi:hypothetical protein